MADEYVMTVREAVRLYRCLATLKMGNTRLSTGLGYEVDEKTKQYRFAVQDSGGRYVTLDPETFCIVTFEDYLERIREFTARLLDLTARQLLVTTWLAGHLATKAFNKALAKEMQAYREAQETLSDDTQGIPELFDEDPNEEKDES